MAKKTRKPAKRRAPARRAPAKKKVQAIPAGYGSVTANLVAHDCAAAIEFYKRAFGARELMRMAGPGGRILHAEIRIGDTIVMLNDEFQRMPEAPAAPASLGGTTVTLMLYVKNCDATFARAVAEGAKAAMPPADMFWGDRFAELVDPFGHRWGVATHVADLTPKQIAKGQEEWMARMAATAASATPPAA